MSQLGIESKDYLFKVSPHKILSMFTLLECFPTQLDNRTWERIRLHNEVALRHSFNVEVGLLPQKCSVSILDTILY
jgi:hypothetical protein